MKIRRKRITDWINHEGVCRTAPATLGLLNIALLQKTDLRLSYHCFLFCVLSLISFTYFVISEIQSFCIFYHLYLKKMYKFNTVFLLNGEFSIFRFFVFCIIFCFDILYLKLSEYCFVCNLFFPYLLSSLFLNFFIV